MKSLRTTRSSTSTRSGNSAFRSICERPITDFSPTYRTSKTMYVAGRVFARYSILIVPLARSRCWSFSKLGSASCMTTISPSKIASRHRRHLFALDLRLDQRHERIPVPDPELRKLELRRQGADELEGEFDLRVRDHHGSRCGNLRRRLHLVLVHERREHEAPIERADRDELLLLPKDRAGERDLPRADERLAEQLERLQADLFRTQVVVPFPEQGRNLGRIDEAGDLEGLRRLERDLLEVFVPQDHVLALRVLVAFHHLLRVDGHVVLRADVRPLERGHAGRVQRREGEVLRLGRAVELDGDIHEAERDRATP